ncbi:MAG: methyltransferase domain-containing protein [Planctomycetota bacterium]|nr:MAG: methyltransferase domain-containing protein [Planctomycetota bacterium]
MSADDDLADLFTAVARAGLLDARPLLEAALRLARKAHDRQRRSDGSEALGHPVRVAGLLLREWEVRDPEILATALVHDVLPRGEGVRREEVAETLGERVARLCDLLAAAAEGEDGLARSSSAPEALLILLAEQADELRSLLRAREPEAAKRALVERVRTRVVPLAEAAWPQPTAQLKELAAEVERRIDAGEADVPDVGPHEEPDAGGEDDPLLVCSPHLSFFRRGSEVFLYHDLVGDIIGLHEKVLGFLDFFQVPRRWSEATTVFASEFALEDLESFRETLVAHLVLISAGSDPLAFVSDWHPLRGPWIVSYREPDGGVSLCYKDRRQGEVVLERLDPLPGRLFRMCGGNLRTSEIIARLEREFPGTEDLAGKVRRTIVRWTHSRRQLLKLLPRPKDAYEMVGLPPYALSTMPYPLLRASAVDPPQEEFETRTYHKVGIDDADEQFDARETTLSHALRRGHPALGGRSYGAALAAGLLQRGVLPPAAEGVFQAVEVGGGTGFFAKDFLDGLAIQAPRLFRRLRYAIVDLSPALRASQQRRTRPHADRVRLVGGDAERLPLATGSVDFLVSNEVIADLRVAPTRRVDIEEDGGEEGGPGAAAVRRYGLDVRNAPGLFFVNVGAFAFLEEVARVLRPGGRALVTEYGSQTRFPEPSNHLDHAEYSIHFGHLAQVATTLGLEWSLVQVSEWIGLDGRVEVLQTTQSFFETLRAFLATRSVRLEKIAYTPESFAELLGDRVALRNLEGVEFGPCGRRVLGLRPQQFLGLVVRKPRKARAKAKKVALDF